MVWLRIMGALSVNMHRFPLITCEVLKNTALRVLLGLSEAGMYPGIVFYISWLVIFSNSRSARFNICTAGINGRN